MKLELLPLLLFLLMCSLLSSMMSVLSFILSERDPNKEKVSVYECGFDPFHNPGEPFSIRFFLMAILFLVFDLEMSYLFPWSGTTFLINSMGQMVLIWFLIVLVLGLIYEWVSGGLEWE